MAVTLTPGSNQGSLNGVTAVEVVAAPAANTTRAVRFLQVLNIDTVVHTIRARKLVAGTPYQFDASSATPVDVKFSPVSWDGVFLLTATNQSLQMIMDEAKTTTDPTFVASWVDRTTS
jgi:hypothetical protein